MGRFPNSIGVISKMQRLYHKLPPSRKVWAVWLFPSSSPKAILPKKFRNFRRSPSTRKLPKSSEGFRKLPKVSESFRRFQTNPGRFTNLPKLVTFTLFPKRRLICYWESCHASHMCDCLNCVLRGKLWVLPRVDQNKTQGIHTQDQQILRQHFLRRSR